MINRKIATFLFILFLFFPSCTGHFQEMNTDQSGITDEDMTVDFNNLGIPLGIIQQGKSISIMISERERTGLTRLCRI